MRQVFRRDRRETLRAMARVPPPAREGPHAGKNLYPSFKLFAPRLHSLDMDQHLRDARDRDLAMENSWPSGSRCHAGWYQQA